jgi:hypothetical protein
MHHTVIPSEGQNLGQGETPGLFGAPFPSRQTVAGLDLVLVPMIMVVVMVRVAVAVFVVG